MKIFYASDLHIEFEENRGMQLDESGTRLLSNQRGYHEESQEELGWNPQARLELWPGS